MRGIEVAFWGTLGRDPDLRTSKSGKPFCGLAVAVTTGKTDDGKDVSQWVRATCFGEAATKIGSTCKKGDRVYCEGSLTLNQWQGQDGKQNTGLNVAAWKVERVSAIGKQREKRSAGPDHQKTLDNDFDRDFDDRLPF